MTTLTQAIKIGLIPGRYRARDGQRAEIEHLHFSGVAARDKRALAIRCDENPGRVTDFLYLSAGPLHTGVFNVADMAITFGVIWLMTSWMFTSRSRAVPPPH